MSHELTEKVLQIYESNHSPTITAKILNKNKIFTPTGRKWTRAYVSVLMHQYKKKQVQPEKIENKEIAVAEESSIREELKAILKSKLLSDKTKLMIVEQAINEGAPL